MYSVKDIIDAASPQGKSALAKKLGLAPSVVNNWYARKSVPVCHWPDLMSAANSNPDVNVTYEDMALAVIEEHGKGTKS